MIKLVIISVISAALAIGGEHLADKIDKGNVKKSETIEQQDSISVDLPTRSVPMPPIETPDAD